MTTPKKRKKKKAAPPKQKESGPARVLTREETEPHVSLALEFARRAGDGPIDAARAFDGVSRVGRRSGAFGALDHMLEGGQVEVLETVHRLREAAARVRRAAERGGADPQPAAQFELTPGFAQALTIVRSAVPKRSKVWGRTLITAALFAPEPLAPEVDQFLVRLWRAAIQDKWATFLQDEDSASGADWTGVIKELVSLSEEKKGTQSKKPDPESGTTEDELQARRNYVPLMSDQPAETDMLKRQHLADVVAGKLDDLQKDTVTDSFMLLLDGPWGAGKTTILGFVQKVLESPQGTAAIAGSRKQGESEDSGPLPWIVISFDAWRQSHVGPAWWGLLSSLRTSVSKRLGWCGRQWFRLWETWRLTAPQFGLAWIFVVLAAAWLLGIVLIEQKIALSSKSLGAFAKSAASVLSLLGLVWTGGTAVRGRIAWGSPRGAKLFEDTRANPMGDLAGHFHWLLKRSPGPVLFVVDDLDRCEQQFVVSFLDAVQTLMRNPHEDKKKRKKLFFIVAADGRWIRRSYEIAHGDYVETVDEPGRSLGYLFLDKLFQVTVPVPALGEKLRGAYLSELLGEKADPDEGQAPQAHVASDHLVRLADLQERIEQSDTQEEILRILKESETHREALAVPALKRLNTPGLTKATRHVLEPYAELLDPNPRSIKRFLMAYNFTRDVRLLEGFSPTEDTLARWTIVRLRWPELADYLRNHPSAIKAQPSDMDEKLSKLLNSSDVSRVVAPLGTDGIRESAGYADYATPESTG